MTLQESKDQVAKNAGWHNWNHVVYAPTLSENKLNSLLEEAAELYAKSKWEEACIAQKELCNIEMKELFGVNSEATQPEFKP